MRAFIQIGQKDSPIINLLILKLVATILVLILKMVKISKIRKQTQIKVKVNKIYRQVHRQDEINRVIKIFHSLVKVRKMFKMVLTINNRAQKTKK